MSKPPAIAVLIVAYNSARFLPRQLAALAAQTLAPAAVIVLDNASDPAERPDPAAAPKWVRVIQSPVNLGFAGGCNAAAAAAPGPMDFYAFLNPDAFPEPDWLAALAAAAARWPDAAFFGSTQLLDANPERLDGAGDAMHALGLPWRGGRGRPAAGLAPEGEVFAPCAAAALIRASDFHTVGGFDAGFFCYCEDADLAFRLRLLGRASVQVPEAVVRHIGGGVSPQTSPFADYHGARNRLWTFVKNMPPSLFWPLLPLHLAVTAGLAWAHALRGRGPAALRGLWAGVCGLPGVLAQRRALQRARTAPTGAIARALVWSPAPLFTRRAVIRPARRR